MRLGVRGKLFAVWMGLIVATVLAAELYLTPSLDRLLTDGIRDDLFVRLRLCERQVSALAWSRGGAATSAAWSELAHDLGRRAAARITLISLEGVVLGDSEIAAGELARVENHLLRPEVQEALRRRQGTSTRHSATLGERMMYAALPYRRGEAVAGVVRGAVALTEVDRAIGKLRRILASGGLVALLAGIILSSLAAQLSSRGLRQLTETARTMAGGDLTVRARAAGSDEIASLGRALDRLAETLSSSLGALTEERDRLGRIVTGMHEGLLLIDGDGRVRLANPALRRMFSLDSEVVGQPLLEVIRHGRLKEVVDRAGSVAEPISEEIAVHGQWPRRLLVHAAQLPGPGSGPGPEPGQRPGLLVVFVEVTDLRRLESVRRDFVANASHELRTPIAAVRSAAETLADAVRSDPDSALGFVEIVERQSARLQRLVDDLLDLSRIESRELRLEVEPLPLAVTVEAVLRLFREPAERKRLRLLADLPADLPVVRADRRALEQVLSNLVDNAVKYCGQEATVTVAAREQGSAVRLSVEDSGPGIEARHLPRLFERFYRVDPGRSRELGGTGLGLSIVKHLTEAMGGRVEVTSVVGEGSAFIVLLPRA